MEFIAIDVETANADVSSICQVGMARYANEELTHEWKTYVDPEDFFDAMNVSIHGISEETVLNAPKFDVVFNTVSKALDGRIVACHTHFDRVALYSASQKYGLTIPTCTWLDTARVARRAWSDTCAQSGYGLASVCEHLGYDFVHHDALEDAKASGHILIKASQETGIAIHDWLKRVELPIGSDKKGFAREGNMEGALHGEVIVFTGALQMPRREAANLAAQVGCDVADGVNKKTTLLVVGDQDISRLAGASKSTKHRKAEELIVRGQNLRIIGESDFMRLTEELGKNT